MWSEGSGGAHAVIHSGSSASNHAPTAEHEQEEDEIRYAEYPEKGHVPQTHEPSPPGVVTTEPGFVVEKKTRDGARRGAEQKRHPSRNDILFHVLSVENLAKE